MSAVLWPYKLHNGTVSSSEEDLYFLYSHTQALDEICLSEGLPAFSELQDFTDMMFNMEELELPEGDEDTTGLMISQGTWVEPSQALATMRGLKSYLSTNDDMSPIPSDDLKGLLEELAEGIKVSEEAEIEGAKFNLSVIM